MDRSAVRDDLYMDDVGVAPAFVMPVQVVEGQFQGARLQPERRLQVAVLADAVAAHARTATETTSSAQQLFAEVHEWFACDVAAGPFSFIGICDSLAIDPGYVRGGLRRLRRIDASRIVRKLTRHQTGPRHQVVRPRERRVA